MFFLHLVCKLFIRKWHHFLSWDFFILIIKSVKYISHSEQISINLLNAKHLDETVMHFKKKREKKNLLHLTLKHQLYWSFFFLKLPLANYWNTSVIIHSEAWCSDELRWVLNPTTNNKKKGKVSCHWVSEILQRS